MTPSNASAAARELIKSYIEHQTLPSVSGNATAQGQQAGEFIVSMHKVISDYFVKFQT